MGTKLLAVAGDCEHAVAVADSLEVSLLGATYARESTAGGECGSGGAGSCEA